MTMDQSMTAVVEVCEWREVGSTLLRCCSFEVMVVEVFLS
jgi:hypothetical protein